MGTFLYKGGNCWRLIFDWWKWKWCFPVLRECRKFSLSLWNRFLFSPSFSISHIVVLRKEIAVQCFLYKGENKNHLVVVREKRWTPRVEVTKWWYLKRNKDFYSFIKPVHLTFLFLKNFLFQKEKNENKLFFFFLYQEKRKKSVCQNN